MDSSNNTPDREDRVHRSAEHVQDANVCAVHPQKRAHTKMDETTARSIRERETTSQYAATKEAPPPRGFPSPSSRQQAAASNKITDRSRNTYNQSSHACAWQDRPSCTPQSRHSGRRCRGAPPPPTPPACRCWTCQAGTSRCRGFPNCWTPPARNS